MGVLEHNRQLKLGAVPSMQQAAISGDPLKREDQVEDIKRYAFGTKGCLHLRYQNLNWGLKIFDLVSCYCLGTPRLRRWGVPNA